ncbi:MAG: hypothetical protein RLZZ612_2384 [Pseudomonadota bacterium]|jgi:hypothetical protein
MTKDSVATIICETHGASAPAIVCRHMLTAIDRVVGFVENSAEPDDLQAWCDECEALFLREGEMTEAFRKFNDFAVVCQGCYGLFKSRHAPFYQELAE